MRHFGLMDQLANVRRIWIHVMNLAPKVHCALLESISGSRPIVGERGLWRVIWLYALMPYPSSRDIENCPPSPTDPNTPFGFFPVDKIVFVQHTGLLDCLSPHKNGATRNPFHGMRQSILTSVRFIFSQVNALPVLSEQSTCGLNYLRFAMVINQRPEDADPAILLPNLHQLADALAIQNDILIQDKHPVCSLRKGSFDADVVVACITKIFLQFNDLNISMGFANCRYGAIGRMVIQDDDLLVWIRITKQ